MKSNNITNVRVVYAPLREFDGYVWYDIETIGMPSRFDLVICDGPAVFESWGELHAGWRY